MVTLPKENQKGQKCITKLQISIKKKIEGKYTQHTQVKHLSSELLAIY